MLNWLKLKIVKSGQMLATKEVTVEAEIQPIRMRLAKLFRESEQARHADFSRLDCLDPVRTGLKWFNQGGPGWIRLSQFDLV